MANDSVIIAAALNGGRLRSEHPHIPYTPTELADDARACAAAGACIVHLHARASDGGWTVDPALYAEALRRVRAATPATLIGITSLRPAGEPITTLLTLLRTLAGDDATRPDLLSINLGHITVWGDATLHYPNDYADVAALLDTCRATGVTPELGVMDIGFVSNAVRLRDAGLLPEPPWFLIELDSPGYGRGGQVAPASAANYRVLAERVRENFPTANWAAHGMDVAGFGVLHEALLTGAHLRVGFEDAICLPSGTLAADNADLVRWAVSAARDHGRQPATPAQARALLTAGQ